MTLLVGRFHAGSHPREHIRVDVPCEIVECGLRQLTIPKSACAGGPRTGQVLEIVLADGRPVRVAQRQQKTVNQKTLTLFLQQEQIVRTGKNIGNGGIRLTETRVIIPA